MNERPDAPAARRNREAILEVLQQEISHGASVLEIGSGTGQHAVHFGSAMPGVTWQTSDRRQHHEGIDAWVSSSGLSNVLPPIELDVMTPLDISAHYDVMFSANTAHIMSTEAVERMFALVGSLLPGDGLFFLYGPFNVDGAFTSDSNRDFDQSLRAQDLAMGIRDLADLNRLGASNGLSQVRRYAMPANNMFVVWQRLGNE
ncbi:MAG: DUF938 domain-containing protein [Woeseiaceae bacterium]|nr:DUF938 domain-containing protein [Woeseiaceae bacterium]